MRFSGLVSAALLSGLSLTSAQYTEILTSAIAELSQGIALITVHSGPAYESALSQAESGYTALTALLDAQPSVSSQYSSLLGVYSSEVSVFAASGATATGSAATVTSSAGSAAASAASSLSSAITSATGALSSVASSTSSAAASSSGSPVASGSGADATGVSIMGIVGAGVLGLAALL